MQKPEGKLTPAQHEILAIAWDSQAGATITEIWDAVSNSRKVGRTTILNLVDRLEKRGWLIRRKAEDGFRYQAAVDRETTARLMATEFVDEFFDGSASRLIMSLLGGKRLRTADAARLRRLLDSGSSDVEPKKGKKQ